jgi:hypothetical protein
MRFLRFLNPRQSRCEVWTAPSEDQRKCLPGLATAITTRDNLGSCLPVSALPCLVLPCYRHQHPDHSPFDMHMRSLPRNTQHTCGGKHRGIGVLQTSLRSDMAHITPKDLVHPRNNPSFFSSSGGRDGRPDIPFRDVAGGHHIGRPRGANHRRQRPDFPAENLGTFTCF